MNEIQLGKAFNNFQLGLFTGVDFRAKLTSLVSSSLPYFVNYYRFADRAIQNGQFGVVPGSDTLIRLDNGQPGPVMPGAYMGQEVDLLGLSALMNDSPGAMALKLDRDDRKTISDKYDKATGNHVYKMVRSIAAEYARNAEYQQMVQTSFDSVFGFRTFIVDPVTGDPIGRLRWFFRIKAFANGPQIQWVQTPTYEVGAGTDGYWLGGADPNKPV